MRGAIACALAPLLALALGAPPARAQGAWRQSEFVIGTGNDPVVSQDFAETRRSLKLARDAYFNVLTGMVAHTDDDHWVTFFTDPARDAARLKAAADLGMRVFLSNNAYTGALGDDVPPPLSAWNPLLPRTAFDAYDETARDSSLDAAWAGYLLFDEPGPHPNTAAWVKAWIDSIHSENDRNPNAPPRAAFLNFSPGDTATMRALASDPDPARRLDAASVDLYPFGPQSGKPCPNQRWGYFATQAQLAALMGDRPWWVLTIASPSIFDAAGAWFCDPDENQLRFMAFGAAAAGAKGILWMGYRPSAEYDSIPDPSYPLIDVDRPGCKYARLREINHYLHDVVGPIAMSREHAGIFHQANGPKPEAPEYMPLVANAAAADCPVADLGDPDLAVGVFRDPAAPGCFELLVINKSLAPRAATVQLRSAFAIAAAPSVVGYAGSGGFSPLAEGASFAVSLAGGEGRMYRLTPAPEGHVALLSPAGGETWLPGEPHEVTWTPANVAVDLALRTDDGEATAAAPEIPIASEVFGGSFTFTMPDVASRAARVVVRASGEVSHVKPLVTAAPAAASATWLLGRGDCGASGAIALGPAGRPVAAFSSALGRVSVARFEGGAWSVPRPLALPPNHEDWMDGYSTALAVGADGQPHVVAFSGEVQWGESLRHAVHYFGADAADSLESVADLSGTAALDVATTPEGDVVVAGSNGLGLLVQRRGPAGWETWGPALLLPGVRGVSLKADGPAHAWVAVTILGAGGRTDLAVYEVTPVSASRVLLVKGTTEAVALALDPAGRPCVAYAAPVPAGGRQPFFASFDGAQWSAPEAVDPRPGTASALALAFDGEVPVVAWVTNRVALLARRESGAWARAPLAATDAAGPIRLAFAPDGTRWAMFRDLDADAMRVATNLSVAGVGGPPAPAGVPTFALASANPLRAGSAFEFAIGLPRVATLEWSLFDVAGRRVAGQAPRRFAAGAQHARWSPGAVPPGAYFLRVALDGRALWHRRLVVLK